MDMGGGASSMEVPESIIQNPERRLVYEPVRPEGSRPSGTRDTAGTPKNSPNTPNYVDQNQGRQFPNNRGKGPKTRGRGPHHGGAKDYYHSERYEGSPRGWQNNRSGYNRDNGFPQSTPIHTHNRFAPLKGLRDIHHDSYSREDDEFTRSPYNYNHNYPGPFQYAGFHRRNSNHPTSPKQNEGPEGSGAFKGKIKRTH